MIGGVAHFREAEGERRGYNLVTLSENLCEVLLAIFFEMRQCLWQRSVQPNTFCLSLENTSELFLLLFIAHVFYVGMFGFEVNSYRCLILLTSTSISEILYDQHKAIMHDLPCFLLCNITCLYTLFYRLICIEWILVITGLIVESSKVIANGKCQPRQCVVHTVKKSTEGLQSKGFEG